ncbi:hypothetical protein VCHA47P369_70298 [Vibrio chagasii]|nr:hypothetical protein VCHA27O13_140054 [Vibrio chagasii]CAH6800202.1 hypothetical protein VCHA34P120_100125 [Vibrio chagasii]CAH6800926.1 hypothetical protein VCHA36O163_110113 [Vibrio chagasii]CAH6803771.1 hypothetical protein VCHA31O73_120082 [Vibrio chagasii]CAH6806063.1 hypothetical protein VCHA35P150_110101 [Vibrio chagasii]
MRFHKARLSNYSNPNLIILRDFYAFITALLIPHISHALMAESCQLGI